MNKIIVVDLDGCLCSVNSFRYWILFSYLFLLFSCQWKTLIQFNKFIILRIFLKSDRVQMKRDILSITENLPQYFINSFCLFLNLFINQNVLDTIKSYEQKIIPIVLCTAAPACYVTTFAEKFNFSKTFATPSVYQSNWKENIQYRKLELLKLFYGEDLTIECVITDHHDDLPLLLKANKRLLVKPSQKTLDKIMHQFEFDIIQ